jgi:Bacterial regulatory protein, Fis family
MSKYSLSTVIEALRKHHGLLTLAADALGCSRQTLYSYVARYPVVAGVLMEERERFVDLAEQGLYDHLRDRSPWAIALVLKTLGRRRGYEDKPATSGPPDTREAQEWQAIQSTLLKALQPYPEARWSVVQALGEHTRESTNGHSPST